MSTVVSPSELPAKPPVKPLRIPLPAAAKMINIGVKTLRSLIADGTITRLPHTPGDRRWVYLDPDEVEAFALGGAVAAKAVAEARARRLKRLARAT